MRSDPVLLTRSFFSINRVVFGPELVMLGPDEQFTQLSLSGGKPKKTNQIRALCLLLGPDFCTDIIVVETADHARLQLQLSYNWLAFVCTSAREQLLIKFVTGIQEMELFVLSFFVCVSC
jgi:hypothetical protein